jgi:hypothetical protein
MRRILGIFNDFNREIWPKWLFRSRLSILGQAPCRHHCDRWPRRWLLPLFLLLLFPGYGWADEFTVTDLSGRQQGEMFVAEAKIIYRFSEKVLEALENGVPLVMDVHLEFQRQGAWIWERDLVDSRLRYRIRYHALSSLYEVVDLQRNIRLRFVTREAALDALGAIEAIPLIKAKKLKKGETYVLEMKAVLDIDALPLPLRPLSYLSPSWNLSSEWSRWETRP